MYICFGIGVLLIGVGIFILCLRAGGLLTRVGQTLDEEGRAAKLLTKIAEGGFMSSGINRLAATRSARSV